MAQSSTVYEIVRRLTAIVLATLIAVLLSGCQVRSTLHVKANSNGTGTIAIVAVLDREAAAAVPDLDKQLQTSDLVKAGWSVRGPSDSDDGSKTITVEHGFDSAEEATTLLRRLSGNGPPFVDFRLQQERTLQHVESSVTGTVDLRQGVSSFGDLALTQSLGSRLGFDPNELEKSLGVDWATTFPLDIVVQLPGGEVELEGASAGFSGWHAEYGEITPIRATASGANARPLVFFGLSAASLLGCLLVVAFWKSGKYRPQHKKNGVRARDLLNQKES
jgi:hypothetical protein